ncbi:hypothetical protein HSX37_11705|uniref:Uncharacterized protein n=1 Tax=Dendrosporobacter quercicolus TaxID=146817 RepID=A0A1G9SJ85_9FIRM|nr:hypothetical protein [Dendrosporobacter quercicolus]NSL48700.1 hypothetical protein [Dendrosporobacter quercicolus DSM 1736]SDM35489.1 hypothetical protein SAMN04488502_10432 [Dendrosporobacter quercicolus]
MKTVDFRKKGYPAHCSEKKSGQLRKGLVKMTVCKAELISLAAERDAKEAERLIGGFL